MVQSTCNVSLASSSLRPCSRTPAQALAFAHMTTRQVLCEYSLSHSSIYTTLLSSICWLTLVFFRYITNYWQVTTKHTYTADITLWAYNIQNSQFSKRHLWIPLTCTVLTFCHVSVKEIEISDDFSLPSPECASKYISSSQRITYLF